MKAAILAFSAQGEALGARLAAFLESRGDAASLTRCESGGLAAWTEAHFSDSDALVFIGSCGIAVRAVVPFVQSKLSDPAVVVVDECGVFAVPLLSGHLGGANKLAEEIAAHLHAIPVVTTATDRNGLFAVDTWAKEQGLHIANPEKIKAVSGKLLAGRTVRLRSSIPVRGRLPAGVLLSDEDCDIHITPRRYSSTDALHLVPPVLTLGVGCKRGIPAEKLEQSFRTFLEDADCHPAAVRQVCSIDLKAKESGLLEFCKAHALPFFTYSAEALSRIRGEFSNSDFVQSVTGVDCVCERSALLGGGADARLICGKRVLGGVTMALAQKPYSVTF